MLFYSVLFFVPQCVTHAVGNTTENSVGICVTPNYQYTPEIVTYRDDFGVVNVVTVGAGLAPIDYFCFFP